MDEGKPAKVLKARTQMRICLANDNFYRGSGAAIAIRRISEALQGVECYFAGCKNEPVQEDITWMPEARFERFDLKTRNPVRLITELVRFRRWFRDHRLDLVNSHHRRVASVLHMAGMPVLYTGQLAFLEARWFRWFSPKYMTAITPSVASNIFETTGKTVLTCIGNPVAFPERPPQINLSEVRSRAVCIARLDPVKGHVHLLAAWKLLHNRGHRFHLDLVGEGSLRADLEAQSAQHGTQDFVHFCGFNRNIGPYIDASLFAILVSEVEGQGIVTLETASHGRASLLTAVTGSIDLLPPDRKLPNGVTFGDVGGLADAIEQWFTNPNAVLQEGQTFFTFLKHSSDPQMIAGQYVDIYRDVLRRYAAAEK